MSERQDRPYNQENSTDKFARIGIHCHEFAHVVGITHSSGSRADVMEAGSRNGPDNRGAAPAPLNPIARAIKGWLTPTVITGQQQFDLYYSLTAPQVFRINSDNNNDYFLIENRRFNQTMVIGATTAPDYNNQAFFPPAWPHGTITQGIFVWRVRDGAPVDYYNNGLIYSSGSYNVTCPEGTPFEAGDGVPFPGNCDVRVLSPWSDSRAPTPNSPPSSGIFVPNTKYGSNVGMEVVSENSVGGYFTVKMYQTNPQDAPPAKPKNLQVASVKICSPLPCRYRPKLTWDANLEPDMNSGSAKYYIYRKVIYAETGEVYCNWTFITSVSYSVSSWIDSETESGLLTEGGFVVFYKIMAKDNTGLFSTYSLETSIGANNCGCSDPIPITQRSDEVELLSINDYSLLQNYPDPFNPQTVISFALPEDNNVKLVVYDVIGREVKTLVDEFRTSGRHNVVLDASDLPSGVYYYRVFSGRFTDMKKMLLIR